MDPNKNTTGENFIQAKADEAYFETVARAITSPMTTDTYVSAPLNDYHRLSIDEVMNVCATENTPFVNTFTRREASVGRTHEWFEDYIPDENTTPVFISELNDPTEQLANVPTRFSNTMGKQGRMFVMSDEAQIVARARGLLAVGPDEFGRQFAIQTRKLVRDMELATIEAQENDGSDTNPRAFRGLLGGYRLAVPVRNGLIGGIITDSNLVWDLGGKEIVPTGGDNVDTKFDIEWVVNRWMYQQYMKMAGPQPNTLYVAPRLLKMLKDAASVKIQINMSQDEIARAVKFNLGGATGKIITNFGILNVVAHPKLYASDDAAGTLNNRPAVSELLFLETNSIEYIDYVGWGGFHVEPRAKVGPRETRLISQIYTMEYKNLYSHGDVHNFIVKQVNS